MAVPLRIGVGVKAVPSKVYFYFVKTFLFKVPTANKLEGGRGGNAFMALPLKREPFVAVSLSLYNFIFTFYTLKNSRDIYLK